jgi:hypothetical protein
MTSGESSEGGREETSTNRVAPVGEHNSLEVGQVRRPIA